MWGRLQEPGAQERIVAIDLGRLRERGSGEERRSALRLAYAFHPFPLQGEDVEADFVLDGDWSQKKEATYVADTRMRKFLRKYGDRESLGAERTKEECWNQYVKRTLTSQNRSASISLEASDERIAPELPRLPSAPEFPTRAAGLEEGEELELDDAPAGVAPRSFADPIAAHRALLGAERTRRLEEQAQELGKWLAGRDEPWLAERRAELGEPFDHLDRQGAREGLRLERDKRIVVRRIREALRQAGELTELAGTLQERGCKLKRRRLRELREDLLDEAKTRREVAERRGAAAADRSEGGAATGGTPPSRWLMEEHGDSVARVAALERELASRELVAERAADPRSGDRYVVVEPPQPTVEM